MQLYSEVTMFTMVKNGKQFLIFPFFWAEFFFSNYLFFLAKTVPDEWF